MCRKIYTWWEIAQNQQRHRSHQHHSSIVLKNIIRMTFYSSAQKLAHSVLLLSATVPLVREAAEIFKKSHGKHEVWMKNAFLQKGGKTFTRSFDTGGRWNLFWFGGTDSPTLPLFWFEAIDGNEITARARFKDDVSDLRFAICTAAASGLPVFIL